MVWNMEPRLLRSFIAVAEEGHVGRAAHRLRIAQPPLSRQMRQLGQQIGAPVLERVGRGIRLTAAGAALLPEARALLAQAEAMRRHAVDAAAGITGRLRLAFVDSAAFSGVLPSILRRFRTAHPGIALDLATQRSIEQVPLLRDGGVDVGVLYWPPDEPSFATHVLERDGVLVALPSGHRLARQPRIRLRDLADERFICFPRWTSPRYHDALQAAFVRQGCRMQIAIEVPQELSELSLVAAGMGPALVAGAFAHLRPRGVVLRPVVDLEVQLTVHACWKASSATDPAVTAFLGCVAAGSA